MTGIRRLQNLGIRTIITIMRSAWYFCFFAITLTISSQLNGWHWFVNVKRWVVAVLTHESGNFQASKAESRIAAALMSERSATNARALQTDDELHNWLRGAVERGEISSVEKLAEQARAANPHYLRLAAFSSQSSSFESLLDQVEKWTGHADGALTHQAIIVRPRMAGMGYECMILAGLRLPDFSPEAMAPGQDLFFIKCQICGTGQPCEIPRRTRSISLECPNCHRIFAMIAPDTKGRFHHMSDYLQGWAPPAHFPQGVSRYDELVLIWRQVIGSVRYVPDTPSGTDEIDTWQFASETQNKLTGDCEDSSIFLADWLIARGFEARIAVGRFAEKGGHAWVVVRLDNDTYLLESTNPYADTLTPPRAADVGSRYVPEALIDRQGFYSRKRPNDLWDGDYFSKEKWQHIRSQHPVTDSIKRPHIASLGAVAN